MLVLSGYGIKVIVEGGHLIAEDGLGSARRHGRFSRVAAGFKRLVLLGHSGIVSLEALSWLNRIGVAIVQIDYDGNVIVSAGPAGLDDARLRRAQAMAIVNDSGLEIAKILIRRKLADQAELLYTEFPNSNEGVLTIRFLRQRIDDASSIEKLRELEARAAGIYWGAWRSLPVRFFQKDAGRVPATGWN